MELYNSTIDFMGLQNLVIDTSALIAVIANEPQKPTLIELTQGVALIAPVSIQSEIGNAFSAMFKRNRVTLNQALQAITLFKSIPIRFVDNDLLESVKIAHQLQIYAYDAYLIRCSLKFNAPLLTLDQRLQSSAQDLGIRIIEVKK